MQPEDRVDSVTEILAQVESGTMGDVHADERITALYSSVDKKLMEDLLNVARYALEWVDAVPADVAATLPAMPGFDRDWGNSVMDSAKRVLEQVAQKEAPDNAGPSL